MVAVFLHPLLFPHTSSRGKSRVNAKFVTDTLSNKPWKNMVRFLLLAMLALLLALTIPADTQRFGGPQGPGGRYGEHGPPGPRDFYGPKGSSEGGPPRSYGEGPGLPGFIGSPVRLQCPSGKFFDLRSGKCRTIIYEKNWNWIFDQSSLFLPNILWQIFCNLLCGRQKINIVIWKLNDEVYYLKRILEFWIFGFSFYIPWNITI
jgi:hypothetical protein